MTKANLKRIVAILLALVLVVGFFPTTRHA